MSSEHMASFAHFDEVTLPSNPFSDERRAFDLTEQGQLPNVQLQRGQ